MISGNGGAFGYSYEAIAYKFPNKKMVAFILTLTVNPKKKNILRHEGEELLFVLKGTMNFRYDNQEHLVEEEVCIYFDSILLHFGEATGHRRVRCLMVIYNNTGR